MLRPALLAILALALAQPDDPAAKDLMALQGVWVMTGLEVDGKDVGEKRVADTTLTIKGDTYTTTVKGKDHACKFRLDPTKEPKQIDMIFSRAGAADAVHKGIYRLDGDTLKLCRGLNADSARPDQFATWPGTGYFVVTWKRK